MRGVWMLLALCVNGWRLWRRSSRSCFVPGKPGGGGWRTGGARLPYACIMYACLLVYQTCLPGASTICMRACLPGVSVWATLLDVRSSMLSFRLSMPLASLVSVLHFETGSLTFVDSLCPAFPAQQQLNSSRPSQCYANTFLEVACRLDQHTAVARCSTTKQSLQKCTWCCTHTLGNTARVSECI